MQPPRYHVVRHRDKVSTRCRRLVPAAEPPVSLGNVTRTLSAAASEAANLGPGTAAANEALSTSIAPLD